MPLENLAVLAIAIIIVAIGIRKLRRIMKGQDGSCDGSGSCQSCGKSCPVKTLQNFKPKPPTGNSPKPDRLIPRQRPRGPSGGGDV